MEIPDSPYMFSENRVLIEFIPKDHSITGVKIPQPASQASQLQQVYLYMQMLVKKHKPDVIVALYPIPIGYPVSLAAKEMQIPLILAFRGNDIGRSIHNPYQVPLIIHCLQTARGAIFVAEDLRRMAKTIAMQMPKSRTIYNGIEPALLERKWQKIRSNNVIFGSVGIFKPKKGIEVFIRVLQGLPRFEKRVILVGDFYKNTCSAQPDGVKITGILPYKKTLNELDNIDIFVAPSFSDGCPNAVLEAMAAGRAIITTPVGAMNDLLRHGESCYFLQNLSDAEMKSAIKKLDEDETFRLSIAEGARRVAESLTLKREINEWEKFLHETTNGN
jgi:glycosyltransferase involved in cell wall biosynthesis